MEGSVFGLVGLGLWLALWLAVPFMVIGLLWLMVRRLKRLEAHVRALQGNEGIPLQDGSDKALVRNLVIAFLAVLLLAIIAAGTSLVLPGARPVQTVEYEPVPEEKLPPANSPAP